MDAYPTKTTINENFDIYPLRLLEMRSRQYEVIHIINYTITLGYYGHGNEESDGPTREQ